ncbi:MAG TPA: response regulator, partial [candidate division Zixibacteria bacterium]|nr:response regulator [candidate division Zixibacteria bacterium]
MTQPSILVVDDELLIRDLLYDFFQQQGWNIAVAENGERALEILRSRKIDVLLTDIKMPHMDGLA